MSSNSMWLRVMGDIPSPEELTRLLDLKPDSYMRRGTAVFKGTWIVPEDVWTATLIEEWSGEPDEDVSASMQHATAILDRIAPTLAALDRTHYQAELYISSIRYEEDGGVTLPTPLVAAAAAGGLKIGISIACSIYEDDEAEEDDASADDS